LAQEYFADFSDDFIELYDDIAEDKRQELYQACRELDYNYKIVLTSFDEKKFKTKILEEYSMDVSVCTPDYRRWNSPWQDGVKTKGSLE
jgi:hypothetical protein